MNADIKIELIFEKLREESDSDTFNLILESEELRSETSEIEEINRHLIETANPEALFFTVT